MDTDNSNSTQQSERDRINEQLDELRQSQQERKPQKKTRPRWKRRLLGFLGVISGLFLLGTSCSKPTVTCYRHAGPEDEETTEEDEEDISEAIKRLKEINIEQPTEISCYYVIDHNDNPDSDSSLEKWRSNPESSSAGPKAEAGIEEVQQYYEKVKQESSVNNVDNAETNNNSDTPTEE